MEDLRKRIKELVEYVERTHLYSSSKIYDLYNEAYNKNERQSTCASCLLTRVRLLKKWLQEHPEEVIEEEVNEAEETVIDSEVAEPTEEETVDVQPEPESISNKKGRRKKNNIEKITTFVIEVGEKSNFKMKCNLLQRFVTS